jgi:hypothetical protein
MRPRSAASFIRPMGLLAAILLAAFAGFGSSALANDTPGNNGTVKIHEGPGENQNGEVRNEPHVCTFHLHFYFADPEQAGTWEIQEWAPTGQKGTVVLSGTYDTHGDGEDRQPEEGVYRLPNGHYKLFWDGDLDTGKHDKMKVFWVDCPEASESPAPTGSEQPIESSSPSVPPSVPPSESTTPSESASTAPSESSSTAPSESASTAPSGSELPGGGSGSPSASTGTSGSELPIGGSGAPTGGVEGAVGNNGGANGGATPPPTDTAGVTRPSDDSWRAIVLALAALIAAATFLIPSPGSPATRRVAVRRDAARRDRR